MNHEERVTFVEAFVRNRLLPVLNAKGPDYARQGTSKESPEDCNNNFKQVARRTGMTMVQVWAVYWLKHVLAIETWLSTSNLRSEKIEGRIVDAINYLLIMATMLCEDGAIEFPSEPKVQ
jgi:hypothetical protein